VLQRTTFETRDRDEAMSALSSMVDSRIVTPGRGELGLRTDVTISDIVTDAAVDIGTEFQATNAPVDVIHIVTTGGVYVVDVRGTEHVATLGQTIRPPTHLACDFLVPRGEFSVTTIPGAAVRDVAREVFVDEPTALDLEVLRPVSPEMESLWSASIAFYREYVLQPTMYDNVLIRQEATRSLITTAILAFGLHRPGERVAAPSAAARRARRHIDENLHLPLTVHDIAAAARLSVRGLQYAFQGAYGESPMNYLRSARLSAVRRELLATDPERDTVSGIARRWGFVHMGRFAAAYRDAYGESPRATLAS
jgi:AraC-like DNA-binding protein